MLVLAGFGYMQSFLKACLVRRDGAHGRAHMPGAAELAEEGIFGDS